MKPQERAKELAAAHWDYTGGLLKVAQYDAEVLALAEFLYKASAVHFYGHALEDQFNGMYDTKGVAAAVADAKRDMAERETSSNLCESCRRTEGFPRCLHDYPVTKDGGCEGYIAAEKESLCRTCVSSSCPVGSTDYMTDCANYLHTENPKAERKASLCHFCHADNCTKIYIAACEETGECPRYISALRENTLNAEQDTVDCHTCREVCRADLMDRAFEQNSFPCYQAKQEAPTATVLPLDFTLPSIALKCTAGEAWAKFCSEDDEWMAAKEGSLHELVERWDCLQALYTFYQRGGDVEAYQYHVRTVMGDLTEYATEGREVMEARRGMLLKNAKRPNPEGGTGYYSPEVNAAIIASKGHRFQPLDEMGVI